MGKGIMQKKKIGFRLMLGAFLVVSFMFINKVIAVIKPPLPTSTINETFPTSYQSYINALKQKYPNATFKAVHTGLNWSTVLSHETYEVNMGISTIHKSAGDEWKKDGKDNYIDGPYVTASKSAVAYVLDPRNSLTEKHIFQFEYLRYNSAITVAAIDSVLNNTPMGEAQYNLYKKAGSWIKMDMSYAQIINKVGQEENVSSMYLASRIRQETGGDVVNYSSINGSLKYDVPLMKNGVITIPASDRNYTGYYNFFNIGSAPNSTTGAGSIESGLRTARTNGWTTPELSIKGGTQRIKSTYIDYGQYTTYFQKFDVNNPYGNAKSLMAWQYQTHILAPRSEAVTSYNGYSASGLLNLPFMFYIPVYNNMPTEAAPYPVIEGAYYETDNTKVYLDDPSDPEDDAIRIRSSADDSSTANVIYTLTEKADINQKTIMTRTKKGINTGWDYVEFVVGGNTIKGYVWNEFVYVYNYNKVTGISLNNTNLELVMGKTATLTTTIAPSDAKYKDVTWSSSNNNVATVSQTGLVTAIAEGTSTITVKTDDQNKIATCQVTVKKYPIALDKTTYTLVIGEEYTPVISTVPIGAEYTIAIENESIAKLEDGKIKAIAEGETKITVSLTGTSDKFEANIKVIPEPEYVISNTLSVKDQIITKVTPGTTVSSIKGKITTTSLTIRLKNASGTILSDTAKVGTGTKIELLNHQNQIIDSFNTVIYGDVNGDGEIKTVDVLQLQQYILSQRSLNDNQQRAGNIAKDGSSPKAVDLLKIQRHVLGQKLIEQ